MYALHTKEQEKYRSSMLYVHKSGESYEVTLSTEYGAVHILRNTNLGSGEPPPPPPCNIVINREDPPPFVVL